MATNVVNLDALITREDLAVRQDNGAGHPRTTTIRVTDLESDAFFYSTLRKPDFQRETSNWSPQKIPDFVSSFLHQELVPAVILWAAGDNVFVIDGAHRLSALIAWVHDDYGQGLASRNFFENNIAPEQLRAADRTRALLNKTVGSYAEHKVAVAHPENSRSEVVARAKQLGSLALELQWVRASDAEKAEASFFKINQEATPIDPTELRILRSRRSPNAIAARAIVRSGTGHRYWSHFASDMQLEIERVAQEVYDTLYAPSLETPIKTLDLPVAGRGYGAQTLPLVFDLVNLANNVKSNSTKKRAADATPIKDEDGSSTIDFLTNTQRLVNRIAGTNPGSLGLHPALYFYGQSGNYQPSAFLGAVSFVRWLDANDKLNVFTRIRRLFEDFLISHKHFVTDVVHKYGSGGRSVPWVNQLYQRLLGWIVEEPAESDVLENLSKDADFAFLIPRHLEAVEAVPKENDTGFNRGTKSAIFLREALEHPHRCNICHGLLHRNSMTVDHIQRRRDGGPSAFDNGQMTHPYCNSTFKG